MSILVTGIKTEKKDFADTDGINNFVASFLKDTGFKATAGNRHHTAIFVGTTFSNFGARKDTIENYLSRGIRGVNPAQFPKGLISYLGGQLSIDLNFTGACSTVSSGFSSGLDALLAATYFLKRDKKKRAVVVDLGEEAPGGRLKEIAVFSLENRQALSEKNNRVEILGLEVFFETKAGSQGLIKAIQKTLDYADLSINQVDYLFGSGVPGSRNHILEKKAVNYFTDTLKLNSPLSRRQEAPIYSSLFLIGRVLRDREFCGMGKKSFLTLFIFLGQDTNSGCILLKVPERRG